MHHWIDEYTPLRVLTKTIEGAVYNRIRIGILRLGTPVHFPLENHKGLTCAMDRHVWFVYEDLQGTKPVMAWLGFRRSDECSLSVPVTCELRAYHLHAGLIMGSALDAIEQAVAQRVADYLRGNRVSSTAAQIRWPS